MDVVMGKPIKKLKLDTRGMSGAIDFNDELADLFANKDSLGADLFSSTLTTIKKKTPEPAPIPTLTRRKSQELMAMAA